MIDYKEKYKDEIESLDRKAKKYKKRARTSLAVVLGGVGLAIGSGIYEVHVNPPSEEKKINDLYSHIRKIKETKKNMDSFGNAYVPSLKEIGENYQKNKNLYDKAIEESREEISNLEETPEIKKYDKKRKSAAGVFIGGFLLAIGVGAYCQKQEKLQEKYEKKKNHLEHGVRR